VKSAEANAILSTQHPNHPGPSEGSTPLMVGCGARIRFRNRRSQGLTPETSGWRTTRLPARGGDNDPTGGDPQAITFVTQRTQPRSHRGSRVHCDGVAIPQELLIV
jgi:hypothetical protein